VRRRDHPLQEQRRVLSVTLTRFDSHSLHGTFNVLIEQEVRQTSPSQVPSQSTTTFQYCAKLSINWSKE
jgi:hypothetical protein